MKLLPLLHALLIASSLPLPAESPGEASIEELEGRLDKGREEAANWVALAKAYEARALALLEEAAKSFEEAAVIEALAEAYFRAGRGEEALALVEKAKRSDSGDPRYWLRLGQFAARLGPVLDEADRDRFFERAVELSEGDVEVLVAAADFYLSSGETEKASEACRQALATDPRAVAPRLRLSLIHEQDGDALEAMSLLEESLLLDRNNAEVRLFLGRLLLRQERVEEAMPHLRKALELDEGEERDFGGLARLMLEVGQTEAALDLLRDAQKRFPDSPDFPFLLSFALASLEKWEEALGEFEKTRSMAEKLRPEMIDARFLYRYGAAYERAGRFEDAAKRFREALLLLEGVGPDDEDAGFAATTLNYLAYMWIERGENLEEAGPLARRALELSPASGAIADTVGWYHFQMGDYPRALADLKKAERLIEEPDPVIFDHLGQTLAKLNEKDLAADYFRRSLELDPENAEVKARLEEVEN